MNCVIRKRNKITFETKIMSERSLAVSSDERRTLFQIVSLSERHSVSVCTMLASKCVFLVCVYRFFPSAFLTLPPSSRRSPRGRRNGGWYAGGRFFFARHDSFVAVCAYYGLQHLPRRDRGGTVLEGALERVLERVLEGRAGTAPLN